jgi:LmbE family N-acetylglucosaminyl deacetylase
MLPDLTGLGTPEPVWTGWGDLAKFPELSLSPCPRTVVLIAPHPGDEVLGAGGTLALLAAAGARVRIVAVTDGEAPHPHSRSITPDQLRVRRVAERAEALRRLGLGDAEVVRCRIPDGGVAGNEQLLADTLGQLVSPGGWCLSPWDRDGHPDHDAVGRAARLAADRAGAISLSYPVWMWHWSTPGDERVPWGRAVRVPLPRHVAEAKRSASAAFTTQVTALSEDTGDLPVLPQPVLARLLREFEVLFR